MKRHHRRFGQVIAALRKDFKDLVLSVGIPAVGAQDQGERCKVIAIVVRKGGVQLCEKADALAIQGFASAHDDARARFCAVFVQPARASDLPLKQRAIEGVLKISGSQSSQRLDDFQPAEVRCVAHRWAPVSAD